MSLAEFHFLRPFWFLALLPALALLVMLFRHRQGRGHWSAVCDVELLPFILQDRPTSTRRGALWLAALATLLSIVALAGPTWQRLPSPAFRNDAALVIALDLSKSMDATDIKPSRIARARYKIADLLQQRKDGQTALLVYGGDAFTVTPLTNDTATIASQLEALSTEIMPSPGSSAVTAVAKAVALLQQSGLAQGHIVLITDGIDGDAVASIAGQLGQYRLSVLAVGSDDGAPIPVGGGGFLKDRDGNIVIAKLNSPALAALAQKGGGRFQAVTDDDADVIALGALFNQLESGNGQQMQDLLLQNWDEKGPWLLLCVLPWAAMRFRKGLLVLCVFFLPLPRDAHAIDWQGLWLNADQRGKQAFDQQRFEQATEQFDDPDWRAAAQYRAGQYDQAAETLKDSKTADGQYNRGNALAKAGQLQQALEAYQQALQLDSNHQDAQFNKELIEKQLQQQNQQQQPSQNSQGDSQQQPPSNSDQPEKNDGQPSSPPSNNAQQDQSQQQADSHSDQDKKGQQQPADQSSDQAEKEQQQQAPIQTQDQNETKDENQRANQQLLKRIPDEPAGLLKRKFKYQYGQRADKKASPDQAW